MNVAVSNDSIAALAFQSKNEGIITPIKYDNRIARPCTVHCPAISSSLGPVETATVAPFRVSSIQSLPHRRKGLFDVVCSKTSYLGPSQPTVGVFHGTWAWILHGRCFGLRDDG